MKKNNEIKNVDIEYFIDKLFGNSKVPKQFLSEVDDDTARAQEILEDAKLNENYTKELKHVEDLIIKITGYRRMQNDNKQQRKDEK